jgi:hypothetical protein
MKAEEADDVLRDLESKYRHARNHRMFRTAAILKDKIRQNKLRVMKG